MSFETAYFECSVGTSAGLPDGSRLPEIVFSGRSNVGKSSMINRLLGRKSLARTSSAPGKTATVNFYNLGFCRFADLPGYGYAKVSRQEKLRWAELVEGYFASEREIVLVVQIVDMRRPPTQDDANMVRFLREKNLPFLLAASKSDKLNRAEREESLRLLEKFCAPYGTEFLPFSAQTGEGVPELKERILAATGRFDPPCGK